jgi:hypothetical protein
MPVFGTNMSFYDYFTHKLNDGHAASTFGNSVVRETWTHKKIPAKKMYHHFGESSSEGWQYQHCPA